MSNLIARLRVLLHAAPTWIVAATIVVSAFAGEIADAFPGDAATWITKIAARVLAGLAAATAIVRRVTPVFESQRGLLTPPDKTEER